MDTTNAKMMLGYMDDDDDEILDYDGNLDLSTDNEDEDEAESVQEYNVQQYPETPDEKIHWQEQIRMIHLRSHLNQLMEKVRHAHYVTDKTREELKKCRNQIQQYEAERDELFAEIQGKESEGNKSAVHCIRAAHERVCGELEGERNLERMIIERLDQAEYELALAEVERGKFLLAEDDLLQREHKLSQEKTDMAMVRLAKEETLARQALTYRRKEDRNRHDVKMDTERRHVHAIEEAERSHERANKYLQRTMEKLKQREEEEAERYKTDMGKKMDMLLKLKNEITHNRENLQAIRARDKAAERKEMEEEKREREIIKLQGGNPEEMLLVKKRKNEVEKQKNQFEADQRLKKAAIMQKILREEENIKRRKQQQPYLWNYPDRENELRVKPLPQKPVQALEDYIDASSDEFMEVEDDNKDMEMLIKLSSRKQPKSVKGTSVEKKIPRERQRKLFATNNEQNDTFAKSLEVSGLSNQKEESNSSSEILTPDKSYLSMLKKLSLDMRKKQEKDEENAQSATDQYEPSIEQTQDLFEVNDSENTEYDLGEGEEMAEDLLDQAEIKASDEVEEKVYLKEEVSDQMVLVKDSDDSEDEEDLQATVNLAQPEFEGLWDKETKPYCIPKETDHYSAKPVGSSKMDQEILKKTLEKTREGIIITQVAAGREFKGCPFYSKPDVIHFKDFVIGKTYKKKVTLTNVSYTVNYIKLLDITERLKDFIIIHFDPPGQMSAGLTCDMTVTFKPMINEDLQGDVNFLTQTGTFCIPLICSTKKCDLFLDTKCVDFGTSVIGETLKRTFTLTNRGALGTKFDFFKVAGMKQRTLTTAGTSLGRMTTDSMRAVSPDSANDLDPNNKTKQIAGNGSSVAVESKKKSEEALDKIPEAGETSVPPLDEICETVPGNGDEPAGNSGETAVVEDILHKQEEDSEEAISPDLPVNEMEEYSTLDGMRAGPFATGEIGPFSSLKLEIVWQPTLPGRVDPEFLVSFADPLSEPLSIRAIANAIDVPVWLERPTVDLKICMFDRLYQDTILVNNRATTALGLKFEVCKELKNHLELLPKTGYVQAQSQFSAQLKFLPRRSLYEEAAKYFDPETGVLEAPMTIRVADQTTPVHFTVQAVVTTSDLEFDVSDIDFGYCTIHESVRRTVKLTNHSILPQQFGFIGLPENMEVQPNDGFGTLLPLETLELDIIFSPNKTREYKLDLVCRSLINRDFKISIRGVGVLTPLELTNQVIHFSATSLYDTASAVLHVVNSHTSSNEYTHPVPRIGKGEICHVGPTSFEFVVPKDSPVTVSPCVGTVMPGKTCRIQICFTPSLNDYDIRQEAMRIHTRMEAAREEREKLEAEEREKRELEEKAVMKFEKPVKREKKVQQEKNPKEENKSENCQSQNSMNVDKLTLGVARDYSNSHGLSKIFENHWEMTKERPHHKNVMLKSDALCSSTWNTQQIMTTHVIKEEKTMIPEDLGVKTKRYEGHGRHKPSISSIGHKEIIVNSANLQNSPQPSAHGLVISTCYRRLNNAVHSKTSRSTVLVKQKGPSSLTYRKNLPRCNSALKTEISNKKNSVIKTVCFSPKLSFCGEEDWYFHTFNPYMERFDASNLQCMVASSSVSARSKQNNKSSIFGNQTEQEKALKQQNSTINGNKNANAEEGSPSENEIDEKINTGLIQDDILDFIDNEFEEITGEENSEDAPAGKGKNKGKTSPKGLPQAKASKLSAAASSSGSAITNEATPRFDPDKLSRDSAEYQAALTSLMRQFKGQFHSLTIPCYVASGQTGNPGELNYSIHNTLYLEVHCPAVRPPVVVISDNGRRLIDFGDVSIGQTCPRSVTIQNISEKDMELTATLTNPAGPFLMLNALRTLPPGATHTLLLTFSPSQGQVFQEELGIKTFNSMLHLTLKGRGVNPLVSLSVEEGLFDMGAVLVGEFVEKHFKVQNTSMLAIDYVIKQDSLSPLRHARGQGMTVSFKQGDPPQNLANYVGSQNDSGKNVFDIVPTKGTIQAGETKDIIVTFAPDHTSDLYSDGVRMELFDQEESHFFQLIGQAKPRVMYLDGVEPLNPTTESLALQPPPPEEEDAAPGKHRMKKDSKGTVISPPALVTIYSVACNDTFQPGIREIYAGCVRTMAVSQKKSNENGEFAVEGLQNLIQKGFSIEPQKGMVEAGTKKPIVFTWTPPSGYDPSVTIEETAVLTLKCDVTEQITLMIRAMVVSE